MANKRQYSAEDVAAFLQGEPTSVVLPDIHSSEEEVSSSGSNWSPDSGSNSEETGSEPASPPRKRSRPTVPASRVEDSDSSSGSDDAGEGPSSRPTVVAPERGRGRARRQQRDAAPPGFRQPAWVAPNMSAPRIPAFTATPGLMVDLTNKLPIDVFSLFLPDSFLEFIVEQTNLYAQQYLDSNPNSVYITQWSPTDVPELKLFLGLTLIMGLVDMPSIRSYWSKSPIYRHAIFPETMPRYRYLLLMRFLHLNDNSAAPSSTDPSRDRLFKLRPLIDHLNQVFKEVYTPEREIAVDESLVPFQGRLGLRQYLPNKRARFGIKLFKLCESGTGYTYAFRVYEGRTSLQQPVDCSTNLDSSGKIVVDLLHPLLNKGYHLYVDSFYTSVPLFRSLYRADTLACGTVRANRVGLPPLVLATKLRKGQSISQRSGELLMIKYRDKRDVRVLTTMHTEATRTIRSRRLVQHINKPVAMIEYTKHMGGVDLSDQRLAHYMVARKTRIWYKKVAIYMIQMALVNSFLIYKKSGKTGTYQWYQEQVILALLRGSGYTPAPGDQPAYDDLARFAGNHFPALLPQTARKAHPQRRCRVCSKHGTRKDSRHYCPKCPSNPGLCLTGCFEVYHTVLNF